MVDETSHGCPVDERLGVTYDMVYRAAQWHRPKYCPDVFVSETTDESQGHFRPPSSPVLASVFLLPGIIRPCAAAAIFIAVVSKLYFLAQLRTNAHLHYLIN